MYFSHMSITTTGDRAPHVPPYQKRDTLPLFCGILVFTVVFQLHYHYLLNHFYHFGMFYNDGGILSQVIWHSDWKLTPPLRFVNYSFFGVHSSPIFMLLNGLSYVLDVRMAEFYSAFVAASYASLSLIFFVSARFLAPVTTPLHHFVIAVLAVCVGFHSIIMNGIWIGHFEYAIPAGIIAFLYFYIREQRALTWIAFALLLSIREDAGLHLVAVLGLVGLFRFIGERRLGAIRRESLFVAIALVYAAFAMWLSLAVRGYHGSTFQQIYSGSPAFAHLSFTMLWDRLGLIAQNHIYLWTGLCLTLIVAWRARNPYLVIGYAAYVPWFLMNWIAVNPNTGQLYAYYAFPFLVSVAWPLFGVAFYHGLPSPALAVRQALKLQAALVVLGLLSWHFETNTVTFGPSYGARWGGGYALQKGAQNRDQAYRFTQLLQSGAGDLGAVIADNGVLSLIKGGEYQGKMLLRTDTHEQADSLVYMRPDASQPAPEVAAQAKRLNLSEHYCMRDTTICLFTKRGAASLGALGALVEKTAP